jgi:hypothetical protein
VNKIFRLKAFVGIEGSRSSVDVYKKTRPADVRVIENRVLRGIFGNKREKVTGHWRKPHNGKDKVPVLN